MGKLVALATCSKKNKVPKMLGWNISVHWQLDGGAKAATSETTTGARLAVWQTDLDGLKWLKQLAAEEKVIDLGGNGYPNRYTATAEQASLSTVTLPGAMTRSPPLASYMVTHAVVWLNSSESTRL